MVGQKIKCKSKSVSECPTSEIESLHLRMARAALGIKTPELCAISGLHRNTINRLESGKKNLYFGSEETMELLRSVYEERGIFFGKTGVLLLQPKKEK